MALSILKLFFLKKILKTSFGKFLLVLSLALSGYIHADAISAEYLTPLAQTARSKVEYLLPLAETAKAKVFGTQPSESVRGRKVELAFSPDQGGLNLVLKTINAATISIDVMAYSFTSLEVAKALTSAQKRGVRVKLIADKKQTVDSKYAVSALSSLVTAGVDVRLNGNYNAFHDKVLIVDSIHVLTGSFNFSKSAAKLNSENVIVLWNHQEVATQYSQHFSRRWDQSTNFSGR